MPSYRDAQRSSHPHFHVFDHCCSCCLVMLKSLGRILKPKNGLGTQSYLSLSNPRLSLKSSVLHDELLSSEKQLNSILNEESSGIEGSKEEEGLCRRNIADMATIPYPPPIRSRLPEQGTECTHDLPLFPSDACISSLSGCFETIMNPQRVSRFVPNKSVRRKIAEFRTKHDYPSAPIAKSLPDYDRYLLYVCAHATT